MKQLQKRKLKKRLWLGLLTCCIVVFLFSAGKLVGIYRDYKEGDKVYENLENIGRETVGVAENELKDEESQEEIEPMSPIEVLHASHQIQTELDINGFTLRQLLAEQYVYDFEALKEINSDVIGWILVEGTNIDYPIVQSKDNQEYLNMTLSGEYNKAGSIFLDSRCREFFGYNTVIYGHNMRNTAMFHDVEKYRDPEFFKAHPLVHIITPEETRTFQIYSCYETPGVSKTFANITSENLYQQYIDYSKSASEYDTGVSVSYSDKIITLSTCTNDFNGRRYIVHAKQIY